MPTFFRLVLSFLAIGLYGFSTKMFEAIALLQISKAAGGQFEDSDSSFLGYIATQHFFSNTNLVQFLCSLVLGVLLAIIWFKPLKKLFSKASAETAAKLAVLAVVGVGALASPNQSWAYYDTQDRPEHIEIAPNETVFWVPANGANKTGQSKFGSQQYYDENKVAAKRFNIPHTLIRNPVMERDMYVPSGKLYIVDRTPYQREWSDATDKGPSKKREGFKVESRDSLDIGLDIIAAAVIQESDASKYLYWYGAVQTGDSNDGAVRYASTIRATPLPNVMDNVVRARIQTLLSLEFGKCDLIECFKTKAAIISAVESKAKAEFANQGITIQFVGLASDLRYSEQVQNVLNDTFIANIKSANVVAYTNALNIQKMEADIGVKKALAEAIKKWNGTLPSWMALPDSWLSVIAGWFGVSGSSTAPTKK